MPAKINFIATDYDNNVLGTDELSRALHISEKWNLQQCKQNPDLVVFHSKGEPFNDTKLIRAKYGYGCFVIAICGEPIDLYPPRVDYSITYKPNTKNNFNQFLWRHWRVNQSDWLEQSMAIRQKVIKESKDFNFCNFIYKNQWWMGFGSGATRRMDLCKLLSRYKQVDCAGWSLNNTSKLQDFEKSYKGTWMQAKIKFLQQQKYKFTIAFENLQRTGYITEKIYHAYQGGTIPIYWGSPDIKEFFNPQSFINCHDYNSWTEVVERVKEIDQNPELFYEYMSTDIITDNSKFHSHNELALRQEMDRVMQLVIAKKTNLNKRGYLTANKNLQETNAAIRYIRWSIFYDYPRIFVKALFKIGRMLRSIG